MATKTQNKKGPYVVAVTGAMGSGKSMTAEIFASMGVPIIDADKIARELVVQGEPAFAQMVEHWGLGILQENGDLDRHHLRELIFTNIEDRKWLEALLHPAIFKMIVQKISEVTFPYCLVIVPLLEEDYPRYKPIVDYVIVMDAPEEQQIARVAARDPSSETLIRKIIHSQASQAARLKIADTVIKNDGTLMELRNQIKHLHSSFLNQTRDGKP